MAMETKRSGQAAFNLNDEPDLSESALDGVVGGTGIPTKQLGSAKTKGEHSLVYEISSLLEDAKSAAGLETSPKSAGLLGDVKGLSHAATTGGASNGFGHHDVELLTDLTSRLSGQEMVKLLGALEHPDAKMTASSILGNHSGTSPLTKVEEIAAARGDHLDVDHKPTSAGVTQVTDYIHETVNMKILGEQLSHIQMADQGKNSLGSDKTDKTEAPHKGSGQDEQDANGKIDSMKGHVSSQYLLALEQTVNVAIIATQGKEKLGQIEMGSHFSDGQLKAIQNAAAAADAKTTSEQIVQTAEEIVASKSGIDGFELPSVPSSAIGETPKLDDTPLGAAAAGPADTAGILSAAVRETEELAALQAGIPH